MSLRLPGVQTSRRTENTGFTCASCGAGVRPLTNGSYRDHCPFCLCSRHVDDRPGDRAATCGGLMEPVGLDHRSGKGWMIRYRCQNCGHRRVNRVAVDTDQPDDPAALAGLATW